MPFVTLGEYYFTTIFSRSRLEQFSKQNKMQFLSFEYDNMKKIQSNKEVLVKWNRIEKKAKTGSRNKILKNASAAMYE